MRHSTLTALALVVAAGFLAGCKSRLNPFYEPADSYESPTIYIHNENDNPHYPSRDGRTVVVSGGQADADCASCCGASSGSVISCGGSSGSSCDMAPAPISDLGDPDPVTRYHARRKAMGDQCVNGECGVPTLWEPPVAPEFDRSQPLQPTLASFDTDPLTGEPLPPASASATGDFAHGLLAMVGILALVLLLGAFRLGRASPRG